MHATEMTEGREFYLGIPHCKKPVNEGARGVPIQLWIASRTDNTVRIEASAIGFAQTHKVKAGTVKVIALPDGLMITENETQKPYAIHITSTESVSVTCYISYKVTGEAFSVRPVQALGKKYYALSLWQDQTDGYKPGQIVVVATEDNTKLTYQPAAKTEKAEENNTVTTTLQKGEVFLVESKVQPNHNQSAETDLTGTYIEANNPIAVFSGHTKGAYPQYTATMLGTPANFMRNLLVDQMPPVETLGTEYIVAPLQYTNRPPLPQDNSKGDMYRFVATEDQTDIFVSRADGEKQLLKSNMQRGDMYEIPMADAAAVYTASRPVLMGQYGKSWRVSAVNPLTDPLNDNTADHLKKEQPTNPTRNGSGCLIVQTPRSQWASYAAFRSPEGMNNFINIVFETADTNFLRFNNKLFKATFGSKVQEIPGTPYSYVATLNASGEHLIKADPGSGARFAAYVYGNFDATKDGFAYGYPVGINYALNLEPDSIAVAASTSVCGVGQGTVHFFARKAGSPVGLSEIYLDNSQSFNYRLTPSTTVVGSSTVSFTLTPVDPSLDAHAVVIITDRTAQRITHTAHYTAPRIVAQSSVDFGLLALGTEECREISLANPTSEPVEIRNIELAGGSSGFTMVSPTVFPLTIPAGGTQSVEICGKATSIGMSTDSLRVVFACYTTTTTTLRIQAGQVRVTMGDLNFGEVEKETEVSREVVIENISVGNLPLELYSADWDDKTHFRTEGLEDDKFPIVLPNVGDTYTFRVFYRPTDDSEQNTTIARFTGNAVLEKTTSTWTGQGKTAVSVSEQKTPRLWLSSIAPQPLSGSGTIHYRLDKPAPVTLSVYTILGERVLWTNAGIQAAGDHELSINATYLLPGMYLCRVEAGGYSATQSLLVR